MAKHGVVQSVSGRNICASSTTIARLETALDRLERLLLEREAEILRLRRIEKVAIETLTELDTLLDPGGTDGDHCEIRSEPCRADGHDAERSLPVSLRGRARPAAVLANTSALHFTRKTAHA